MCSTINSRGVDLSKEGRLVEQDLPDGTEYRGAGWLGFSRLVCFIFR